MDSVIIVAVQYGIFSHSVDLHLERYVLTLVSAFRSFVLIF